jgi:formamidopyrimidine-DNA glycosylase
MPELPEVEVLVRHLGPRLRGKTIRQVHVFRPRVLAPTTPKTLAERLRGAAFTGLTRRGKYLLFELAVAGVKAPLLLVGHLGMTGRMYLLPPNVALPKHTAVVLDLDRERFVFEDTRYFGKLTLNISALEELGPEPLSDTFTAENFGLALRRSRQSIKVKLLDQSLVAGVGNIYASEALFRAGISPRKVARRLKKAQVELLWRSIREVLNKAIDTGSTAPLDFDGQSSRDGLFYYGRSQETPAAHEERFWVYDRAGKTCRNCGAKIRRLVQAARSTYYCPHCQAD